MSAIACVWKYESQTSSDAPTAQVLVETMLDGLSMHGGLRRFVVADGAVACGGLLTHILPEDPLDRQPLWSADRTSCLVADVRLDNRDDLVRELGLTRPDELADSDILFAAWQRWGEACLDHLIGAFAFAVWQPRLKMLFAARDHTGERGLHFHRAANFFALASMPKGLLAIPGVFRGFNEQRVVDCLVLTHPGRTSSYYAGIERLPPGHMLRVTPNGVETRQYWHPCDAKPLEFARDAEYAEALREILDRATAARLRTHRGIAAQLSAGMDSSTVVANAARLLAPDGRGLTAFTSVPRAEWDGVGWPGRLAREGPGAADVAAMYPNVEHVLLDSAGYNLVDDMNAWTEAMDEPAQNCVNLLWMTAIMSEARARGAGVMLHGVAGNATVSANGWEAMTIYFRTLQWQKLYRFATNLRTRGEFSYKASIVLATNGLMPRWMKERIKPGAREVNLDYSPVNPAIAQQYNLVEKAFEKRHGTLPDIRTQRAMFFERFDHAPMNAAIQARFGLDNRDPLGDKRVFEFCFAIPIEQYAAGHQSRSLIRRTMQGRLPEATLARNVRGQQGVDWYLTVEEALPDLAAELGRIAESAEARRLLDLPRLNKLASEWPSEGHEGGPVTDAWNSALTRGVAIGHLLNRR
jgi:asparagine synthase (glutamine-hydrolysing)